ncbi:MAG: GNAT family N-acetyltransferase [Betaproteobacteria bacterium]|nr:GNAT family N-acetyltransferase [Betaproteobacteria bacterium]
MTVRRLLPSDAEQFQSVRLCGLQECPSAFASSHEEEVGTPLEVVAQRLAHKPDGAIFGWFAGPALRGVVGVQREGMSKLAHKAYIWGMYVAPDARRSGVGQELLVHALAYARDELGVRQVNLGVNTQNAAAISLYRRVGFEVYGTEREFLLVDGVLHDEHHMVCQVRSAT